MDDAENVNRVFKCLCGFAHTDPKKFGSHIMFSNKKEPGQHKSLGLFNLLTGELIQPPLKEMTPEQLTDYKTLLREKQKEKKAEKKAASGVIVSPSKMVRTEAVSEATAYRFVPRVYEAPLSPIMIGAREAATNVWGWPKDMSLADFLDTWLYFSFKAFGITLITYSVDESVEEQSERLLAQKESENSDGEGDDLEGSPEELEEVNAN
ncbi:MAG: hypothetical protein PHN44_00625 [Candidatus Marinimicrobia bacterium]|nr:hypothetical protein [Candidatus Neomarinimicrobiota bacterium]MDD5539130.1 hypothetical protein [Candidatus Neomarinimicrobiota bacterium]